MPVNVATGVVTLQGSDISWPGKFPLDWSRTYKSSLAGSAGMGFGKGWTSPAFAALTREGDEYSFRTAEGGIVRFNDPDKAVERGAIMRNLGSFMELSKEGLHLVVTQWNLPGSKVLRHGFLPDRNGKWWFLRFLEAPDGQGLEFAWDPNGSLKAMRQRLERRALVFENSPDGRIQSASFRSESGKLQPLARYEYDAEERLVAVFDALGYATRYGYDSDNRIIREEARDGGVFGYKYDSLGRCIRTSGLDGYDLKIIRYYDNMSMSEVTDSHGAKTRYEYVVSGQITSVSPPLSGPTRTEYDAAGRVVKITGPGGAETTFEFDESGNRAKATGPTGRVLTTVFGEDHLPRKIVDPAGFEWEYAFDARSRLISVKNPRGSSWSFDYDEPGNIIAVTFPDGSRNSKIYDERGNLVAKRDPSGNLTEYETDAFGRLTAKRGPLGNQVRYIRDLLGRPAAVELPEGTIRYGFDAAGNIVSRSQGGRSWRYQFGSCSRLLKEFLPDGTVLRYRWGSEPGELLEKTDGTGSVYAFFRDAAGRVVRERSPDGREIEFRYDAAGNISAMLNGLGEAIRLEHDLAGRLIRKILPDGSVSDFAYGPNGKMLRAENPDALVEFEYDEAGNLTRETVNGEWVSTEYDACDRPLRRKTNFLHSQEFSYDKNGFVASMELDGIHSFRMERSPFGEILSRGLPGGIDLENRFDEMGRLARSAIRMPPTASPLRRTYFRAYHYGPDGLLATAESESDGTAAYEFDAAEQLTKVVSASGSVEEFGYDAAGNQTTRKVGAETAVLEYGAGNRILRSGKARFRHDGNGRITGKIESDRAGAERRWSYTWNADDRLVGAVCPDGSEWKYVYDPFGRRIAKSNGKSTTRFLWSGDRVIHETDTLGRVGTWVYDEVSWAPLYKLEGNKVFAVLCDRLGTPELLLGDDGRPAWSATRFAWGRAVVAPSSAISCDIRFPGQWHDEETGLHYNRHRYYDPDLGRFISPDPIRTLGGLNLYQYATNPVHGWDPLGLCRTTPPTRRQREQIEDLRSGKDIHVRSVEEARALLEHMPDLRPHVNDSRMPVHPSEAGHSNPLWKQPDGTYRGDLTYGPRAFDDQWQPTGDRPTSVHPDVGNPDHRDNAHYNIRFHDGTKAAIIIDS